ncbi:MAG: hypothetical protein QME79_11645 [Bacillota bacterium]|nr:hypothetical protein [Bacillota bacterium]
MRQRVRRALLALAGVAGLAAVAAATAFAVAVNSPGWRAAYEAFRTTHTTPASYTQVIERRLSDRWQREEFRVWQSGIQRKIVQTVPAALSGLTIARDGRRVVAFAPDFPYALESPFPRALWSGRLGRWPLSWRPPRMAIAQGALPDGAPARTVTISAGGRVQMKLWIDPLTGFVLRQERYSRTGELFDVTVNRDLVTHPPGLAAELAVRVPQGATYLSDPQRWRTELVAFVFRKEAPFPFLLPKWLPSGYRLAWVEPLEAAGTRLIAFRFARGQAGFTLFEYPAGNSVSTASAEAVAGAAVSDRQGGVRAFKTVRSGLALTVVGRLSEAEAHRLFSSLQTIYPAGGKEKPERSRTHTP